MYNGYSELRARTRDIIYRVFGWMAVALSITGLIAFWVAHQPHLAVSILKNPFAFWPIVIAQFGLVIALSGFIQRIAYSTGLLLFIIYSILNGLTLSVIFLAYTSASIATTFFITAGMFASMALYGMFTKADLSGMGAFLRMALWGLIIALLVNLFLANSMMEMVISIIGVVVFSGLTAYDINMIQKVALMMSDEGENRSKIALIGALALYLDFINLFLMLLNLMGNRRRD